MTRLAMGYRVQRVRQAITLVALRAFGKRGRRRLQQWISGQKLLLTTLAVLAILLPIGLRLMARNRQEPASDSAVAAAQINLAAAEPSAETARETSADDVVVVAQSDDLKWDRLASRRQRLGLEILGVFSAAILLLLAFRIVLTTREARRHRGRPRRSNFSALPPG